MVLVSPQLLSKHVSSSSLLRRAYQLLEEDVEVVQLLRMSNVMAVNRLRYNDHGITHARIVAGASLEMAEMLQKANVTMCMIREGTAQSFEEVKLALLIASYLHDIGNAIHREGHELLGALMAKDIVDRLLAKLGFETHHAIELRQEIMHIIYSTAYNVRCLSTECGILKVSDGLDMAEGRARVPYRLGKMDMHAVSALSIRRVELERGERPVRICVHMNELAGLFQIEAVLLPKIKTSSIDDYLEVFALMHDKHLMVYPKGLGGATVQH